MLTLLLALLSGADAQDLQPGVALPGATRMDELGVYAGGGALCDTGYGCGFMVQSQVAVTEELGFIGQMPIFLTSSDNPSAAGSAGVRYNVVDADNIRVAPIAAVGTQDLFIGNDSQAFTLAAGAAGEVGDENIAIDAALPILFLADSDLDIWGRTFGASEIGVTVGLPEDLWAQDETNHVRVGFSRADPFVSYRLENESFWAEADAVWSTNDGDFTMAANLGAIF